MLPSRQFQRILYPGCPLCESKKSQVVAKSDCSTHELWDERFPAYMTWLECEDCKHVYTEGYFGSDGFEALFAKSYNRPQNIEMARATSAAIVEKVQAQTKGAYQRWLDVGPGDGSLLDTAEEYGFSTFGIDTRLSVTKALSHRSYCGTLEDYHAGNPTEFYNVISLADVLEHVPYPKELLRAVMSTIAPGGVIFVSCPNMRSITSEKLTKAGQNPYWGEIEHFHNFGRDRLYSLLEECGFRAASYGISNRYRLGMEIVARLKTASSVDVAQSEFHRQMNAVFYPKPGDREKAAYRYDGWNYKAV